MFTMCFLLLQLNRATIHDANCRNGDKKDLDVARAECHAANKDPLTMCDSFMDSTQLKWFFVRQVAQ